MNVRKSLFLLTIRGDQRFSEKGGTIHSTSRGIGSHPAYGDNGHALERQPMNATRFVLLPNDLVMKQHLLTGGNAEG
jgi:hypothetical protein